MENWWVEKIIHLLSKFIMFSLYIFSHPKALAIWITSSVSTPHTAEKKGEFWKKHATKTNLSTLQIRRTEQVSVALGLSLGEEDNYSKIRMLMCGEGVDQKFYSECRPEDKSRVTFLNCYYSNMYSEIWSSARNVSSKSEYKS